MQRDHDRHCALASLVDDGDGWDNFSCAARRQHDSLVLHERRGREQFDECSRARDDFGQYIDVDDDINHVDHVFRDGY